MADKKIVYKEKKSPKWGDMINAALNGTLDISLYSETGEVYISLKDDGMNSVVLNKDGTWGLG